MADSDVERDELSDLYREREGGEKDLARAGGQTEDQSAASTRILPAAVMNRQERDVALADLLLEDELVDERQLEKALSDWTIHGSEPLLNHLIANGVVTEEQRESLDAKVTTRLEQLVDAVSSADVDGQATVVPLDRLDSSGRAATLLGMRPVVDAEATEQSRRFTEDYTLLRKLGQGGLGVVWLARDNSLRRYVAIKEVREAAQNDPAAVGRFRREAVITGRLEHPSVVPIHQFGEDHRTGRTFYAMRFLGKRTLQSAIDEYHERRESGDHDPMHLHHLLSTFVSVCQAIAYAHSKDVVHRDLKPENVALDGYGQVIVLDWGLAKLIGDADLQEGLQLDVDDSPDQANRTIAGQVMGTPMYMAPEQAAGRVDDVDERTDVYGLGAILFAILTGYAPHELSHRSLSSQSKVSELLTAIMNHPTPRARELNGDVSPELESICAKALAKKRYARYASASDLAEDVQRSMAGEPVSAYDERWQQRAQRWIRSHRRLSQFIAGLAVVVLVSLISMGVVTHQNRRAQERVQFENLRAEARELEIRLASRTAALANHVRFMADLPPIQGIIDAENVERTTEDETTWRERLETIFRGLLRSNQDYLKVVYLSAGEDLRELVRVERQTSEGSFVRALPESRLNTYERSADVEAVLQLSPGDVVVRDDAAVLQTSETSGAEPLTMLAATPVYDEQTGELFGVVGIEMNLERVLGYLLDSTDAAADVFATDSDGTIVMHHSRDRGQDQGLIGTSVAEVIPRLQGFFSDTQRSDVATDDSHYYAVRARLDSRRDGNAVGLILTRDAPN